MDEIISVLMSICGLESARVQKSVLYFVERLID